MALECVREYAELIRDVVVILGVPALFAVGKWLYDQRISSQKAQIELLRVQLEDAKTLRYDNAHTVIEAQKALYELEIEAKEDRITELHNVQEEKHQEVELLRQAALNLREKVEALEKAQSAIGDPSTYPSHREESPMMRFFRLMGEAAIARAKARGEWPSLAEDRQPGEQPSPPTSPSTPDD